MAVVAKCYVMVLYSGSENRPSLSSQKRRWHWEYFSLKKGSNSEKWDFSLGLCCQASNFWRCSVTQVVQMHWYDDPNKHIQKRWMPMRGYCHAALFTVMYQLGSICPMEEYIDRGHKHGDATGPNWTCKNYPDYCKILNCQCFWIIIWLIL